MGILSKLFGGGAKAAPDTRQVALAALESATASGEATADAIVACFPDPSDFEAKFEGVNRLFSLEREKAAEALGLHVCNDPACPLGIRKGLLKHFLTHNRVPEIIPGIEALLKDRPSETEFAIGLARHLLRQKEYERALSATEAALKAAPNSIRLYALVGEAHLRLAHDEDAINHLRVSCELFESTFKRGEVMASEFNTERLEFNRVFALLQEAARRAGGQARVDAAVDGLTLIPSGLGIVNEGDKFAVQRIEYVPPSKVLESIETQEAHSRELTGAYQTEAQALFLRATIALRRGDTEGSSELFRAALDMDTQHYGAFYGWAVSEELNLAPPPPVPDAEPASLPAGIQQLLPDWEAMLPRERAIAAAAAAPIAHLVPALAAAEARLFITPMDVRITDLYPEVRETHFLDEGRPPKCLSGFCVAGLAYARLDHVLWVGTARLALARHLGLLLFQYLRAEDLDSLRKLIEQVRRSNLPMGTRGPANTEELVAFAVEQAALRALVPASADAPLTAAFERTGVFKALAGFQLRQR